MNCFAFSAFLLFVLGIDDLAKCKNHTKLHSRLLVMTQSPRLTTTTSENISSIATTWRPLSKTISTQTPLTNTTPEGVDPTTAVQRSLPGSIFTRENMFNFSTGYSNPIPYKMISKLAPVNVPVCTSLPSFKQIDYSLMDCGGARRAASKVSEWALDVMTASMAVYDIKACVCTALKWHRRCSQDFLGRNWKEEDSASVQPELSICRQLCLDTMSSGATVMFAGGKPEWHCWWMKNENTYSVEHKGVVVTMPWSSIAKSGNSPYCEGGSCDFRADNIVCYPDHCIVIYPISRLKESISPRQPINQNFEVTILNDQGLLGIHHLYRPAYGALLEYVNCSVEDAWGRRYHQTSNGVWIKADSGTICTEFITSPMIPPLLHTDGLPTKEDLIDDLRECILTRQVIINAKTAGADIDAGVLKNLNYLNNIPGDYAYFTINGSLFRGWCDSQTVDQLSHAVGDIWEVFHDGNLIGCLDARLDIIFQSGCLGDEGEPTETQAMGLFEFVKDPEEGWTAKLASYSYSEKLSALEETSSLIKDYLQNVMNTGSVIIPGMTNVSQDVPPQSSDGTSNWGTLEIFGVTFSSILGLLIFVLLIYCCCRCCKNDYQRIEVAA